MHPLASPVSTPAHWPLISSEELQALLDFPETPEGTDSVLKCSAPVQSEDGMTFSGNAVLTAH
jgi:hypothetical protein